MARARFPGTCRCQPRCPRRSRRSFHSRSTPRIGGGGGWMQKNPPLSPRKTDCKHHLYYKDLIFRGPVKRCHVRVRSGATRSLEPSRTVIRFGEDVKTPYLTS
ncbi:uncharacterized protein LOC132182312 isoform X2 [Corylus avellana]|uniref:uncharacterized protein LOC132182312 isoform X2 n=1 Tax=Corylus avellana TaxID=13451 RepID=UPI00286AC408|nr:uncharacterized protein LOC132182312 isoform X2 [Corylus avellana]